MIRGRVQSNMCLNSDRSRFAARSPGRGRGTSIFRASDPDGTGACISWTVLTPRALESQPGNVDVGETLELAARRFITVGTGGIGADALPLYGVRRTAVHRADNLQTNASWSRTASRRSAKPLCGVPSPLQRRRHEISPYLTSMVPVYPPRNHRQLGMHAIHEMSQKFFANSFDMLLDSINSRSLSRNIFVLSD